MKLRYRLLNDDAVAPKRAHMSDAGFDICSTESLTLDPGERALISTGVALDLEPETFVWIVPRSGLAAKHGITIVNSPGLIDPDYRGEVKVVLANSDRKQPFEVEIGMRMAQLVIGQLAKIELEEVSELSATARGEGGFGSSGLTAER